MISQLQNPYNYSAAEVACINNAGNNWDSRSQCIVNLKDSMNTHYDFYQRERCCYCGLLYDRTGRGEIDHIAPKGQNRHPQFTFTEYNLAKACQLCNSSSMKHMFDTIHTLHANYTACIFKIVHPYLDDHNQHYSWQYGIRRILISVRNNSAKAKESIRLFELDSERRTRARAIERHQEWLDNLYGIPAAIKQRILSVIRFK